MHAADVLLRQNYFYRFAGHVQPLAVVSSDHIHVAHEQTLLILGKVLHN